MKPQKRTNKGKSPGGIMAVMRQHMATILIILLILFLASMTIGGLVGGANILDRLAGKHPTAIAMVNGQEIPYETFYKEFQKRYDGFRQQTGREPEAAQIENLRNQTWEALVAEVLLRQEIKRRGIRVYDKEIVDQIYTMVKNDTTFFTNGRFDETKFQQALRNPYNDRYWHALENQIRHDLPILRLQDRIVATVRVTDEEIKREFIKRNLRAKVKYIFFDPTVYNDKDVVVTAEEINTYYKKHQQQFREGEKRKIDYVLFQIKPTDKDTADVWADAEDLLQRVKEGEDFAELAQTYSEDPGSSDKGGDLGYFGKGYMVKPFEDAAFSAKVGEVVGPVQSSLGLHIIKVEDRKIESGEVKIKARHILLKFKASPRTLEDVKDRANYLATAAQDGDFRKEAEAENLEVKTTPFFPKGDFVPGIGIERKVAKSAFKGKVGEVSDVLEIKRGLLVARIAAVQKERTKPISEVQENIRAILVANKKRDLAQQHCAQVRARISRSDDFERVALQDSLQVKETTTFSLDGYVSGIGREPQFIGTAFGLEVGALAGQAVSGPIETSKGYYLIKLLEKTPFDQSQFERDKENLRAELLIQKRQSAFNEWFDSLKEKADIEDYRDRYF